MDVEQRTRCFSAECVALREAPFSLTLLWHFGSWSAWDVMIQVHSRAQFLAALLPVPVAEQVLSWVEDDALFRQDVAALEGGEAFIGYAFLVPNESLTYEITVRRPTFVRQCAAGERIGRLSTGV
ncbi:hypothetical protein [Streptomyces sp. UNOC14_S4]|uniref:hypothetical protein n=1 Tax=Streptomyces sp. UNOC14_S4 TaxID=2872340 RepID=UPI001E343647|nr:hypothetical protein [Streptomyces sp. UNOC14_S4]MCC3766054.1 hypothetical protein [Streptomyces sp. UNOC14_S4]